MALSKKPYKGTRDFIPTDKRIRDYLFHKMSESSEMFGYEPYDGPLVEEVELYKAKSGEELINEQIYSFNDRGERFIAIRPEMTPTVARMIANFHREAPKPIRWYSIPNVMRYERPQKGRLREHWQLNCDIFGAPGRQGEVEIIQVAIHLMNNFGANQDHFEILLNDRAIVDKVFNELMKTDKETSYRLYKIVDKAKKVDQAALDKMISELSLDSDSQDIFYNYLKLSTFDDVLKFLKENKAEDIIENLNEFLNLVKELDLINYIKYDPTIVRGLDYYTGIVFEIFDKHPDNRRAICGGGAYANLLQIFNEQPLAGVGFGLGDVTLRNFLEVHNLLPNFSTPSNDLFITFQDEKARNTALKLAAKLRKNGVKVITGLDTLKFKKVFPLAEKKGAKFVAFFGENELSANQVQIKSVTEKSQHNIDVNDIDALIKLINQQ